MCYHHHCFQLIHAVVCETWQGVLVLMMVLAFVCVCVCVSNVVCTSWFPSLTSGTLVLLLLPSLRCEPLYGPAKRAVGSALLFSDSDLTRL